MAILFVLGAVVLLLGLLFISGQNAMKRLDEVLNKTVVRIGSSNLDRKKEILLGVALVIFSFVLFAVGFSLKR
jgi:hypothetical protein